MVEGAGVHGRALKRGPHEEDGGVDGQRCRWERIEYMGIWYYKFRG